MAVSAGKLEGDCFRDGRVCHLVYYENGNDSQDKDAYRLGSTSCKTAAAMGPFLVPLESPVCGKDPFPSCPSNDLWPDSVVSVSPMAPMNPPLPVEVAQTPMAEVNNSFEGSLAPMDHLINHLCGAAMRCQCSGVSLWGHD